MANETKKYRDKYHHALDRMFDLFSYGREVEHDLDKKLDYTKYLLKEISNICAVNITESKEGLPYKKIKDLCNEGMDSIIKDQINQ